MKNQKIFYDNFVVETKKMNYTGFEKEYQVVVRKPCVIVVPFFNNQFVLINEFRPAIEKSILQFPAGKIEESEKPLDAARRELIEETGFIPDKLTLIREFYTAPHFSNEKIFVFVAECNKRTSPKRTDREKISTTLYYYDKLNKLFDTDIVLDAKTLVAWELWKRWDNGKT